MTRGFGRAGNESVLLLPLSAEALLDAVPGLGLRATRLAGLFIVAARLAQRGRACSDRRCSWNLTLR